jgi:hypothetical protein
MNLFNMTPDEIVRWYKPQTENEAFLFEAIQNLVKLYDEIEEVLENHDLHINPSDLDAELGAKQTDYDDLADEYKTLQDEFEDYKNESTQ